MKVSWLDMDEAILELQTFSGLPFAALRSLKCLAISREKGWYRVNSLVPNVLGRDFFISGFAKQKDEEREQNNAKIRIKRIKRKILKIL